MIKRIFSRSAVARFSLAIALVGLTSIALPKSAFASTVQCVPTDVAYNGLGYEIFQCGGVNYSAWNAGAPSGCVTQFIDTIKLWTSMGQSALLAGKKIQVTYGTCGPASQNFIQQIDLLQ